MKTIAITKNEAGQRLDKFLAKYLNLAPKSFLYKMLRKKNITLNGRQDGRPEEIVQSHSPFASDMKSGGLPVTRPYF